MAISKSFENDRSADNSSAEGKGCDKYMIRLPVLPSAAGSLEFLLDNAAVDWCVDEPIITVSFIKLPTASQIMNANINIFLMICVKEDLILALSLISAFSHITTNRITVGSDNLTVARMIVICASSAF